MASIDDKQRVERRMLDLLTDAGMELPDEVEYGFGCVRFIWWERRVAVVVDIDDPGEFEAAGSGSLEDGLC